MLLMVRSKIGMHNKHDINLLKRGPHYLLSILRTLIAAETVFSIKKMKIFSFLATIIFLSDVSLGVSSSLNSDFLTFKQAHNKNYKDAFEEVYNSLQIYI